ncbi:MAG: autotransporter-associated beta strand repeat-containing protein, partial [Verrucomicrobia bacterium]|nr:autotransporter-associated beta strand repeat-containing protein [Verrucomicrobiota bacterium]
SGAISGPSMGLTKLGLGTLKLTATSASPNTYTGAVNVNAGTLEVSRYGWSQASTGVAVAVANNAKLKLTAHDQVAAPGLQRIKLASLSIGATASLVDVGETGMIINSALPSTIRAAIVSGRAGGTWAGLTGITSSRAKDSGSNGAYAVGWKPVTPGSLVPVSVTVAVTLKGDADLNGRVNGVDYGIMAGTYGNTSGMQWYNADFNYNGRVDGVDYGMMASNFGTNLLDLGSAGSAHAHVPTAAGGAITLDAANVLGYMIFVGDAYGELLYETNLSVLSLTPGPDPNWAWTGSAIAGGGMRTNKVLAEAWWMESGNMQTVGNIYSTSPGGFATGVSANLGALEEGQFVWVQPIGNGVSSPEILRVGAPPIVPEPSALILLGTGLVGLFCYAWRKRK